MTDNKQMENGAANRRAIYREKIRPTLELWPETPVDWARGYTRGHPS